MNRIEEFCAKYKSLKGARGNAESGAQLQVGVQPAVRPRPRDTAGPRGSSCSDKWVTETRDTED